MTLPGTCTEVEVTVRETTRGPPVQHRPSITSLTGGEGSNGTTNLPRNGDLRSYDNQL